VYILLRQEGFGQETTSTCSMSRHLFHLLLNALPALSDYFTEILSDDIAQQFIVNNDEQDFFIVQFS
jgi:hypothetical protein